MYDLERFAQLQEVDVRSRRVFVRADLDAPVDGSGQILDHAKILAAIPTLRWLLEAEAQVIVGGHRGRPVPTDKPERRRKWSLDAVGAVLAEQLGAEVYLPEFNLDEMARKLRSELRPDRVLLLENLALEAGEVDNDEHFARQLAEGVDVYVGDNLSGPQDFASMRSLARLCPDKAPGLRVRDELQAVSSLKRRRGERLTALLGGTYRRQARLMDELLFPGVVLCLGGPLGNSALAATDQPVGSSPVEDTEFAAIRTWLKRAEDRGVTVLLPKDALTTEPERDEVKDTSIKRLHRNEQIVDLGPNTVAEFAQALAHGDLNLVVGFLGRDGKFADGTRQLLGSVADNRAISVVVNQKQLSVERLLSEEQRSRLGFISTADTSFVDLLCEKRLVGLDALLAAE